MPRKPKKRPPGHGTIWEQGGNWWIRWREGGSRMTAKFTRRIDAEQVLAQVISDVSRGGSGVASVAPDVPKLTVLAEPWIQRRRYTHRSWNDDKNRWNKHVGPFFGDCKPADVDAAMIRRFIETKLAGGLSSASVRNCVRLLSTFFTDVVEQGFAKVNPLLALPRSAKRLLRSSHDPKQTPFIESQDDIRRVFQLLEQPWAALFALSALGGLRPGEVLALEWGDFSLETGRLLVQRQVRHGLIGPPKSGKPRLVPMIPALLKIVKEHHLATGGVGRLFPPQSAERGGTPKKPAQHLSMKVMHRKLRVALKACGLPETMTLYHCGRHTYGAQHVMGGGSLATLREILGHSSVQVTERYGHLRADLFKPSDLLQLHVDMSRAGAAVIDIEAHRADRGTASHGVTTDAVDDAPQDDVSTQST